MKKKAKKMGDAHYQSKYNKTVRRMKLINGWKAPDGKSNRQKAS